jgi:hypothetical protein
MFRKIFLSESGRVRVWLVVLLVAVSLGLVVTAAAVIPDQKVQDRSITACVAITNASVQYVLPDPGAFYYVSTIGNSAYLLCGAAGVAATAAINGHSMQIPEGVWTPPIRLVGPNCAVIGPSTAGQICFVYLNPMR